jgi:hypothetical protein
MNRIRRVGPMLEAAQPRDYKRIDAEEYYRMLKRREQIPWKVRDRILAAATAIARESDTEITCGDFDDHNDIRQLGVTFTRSGGPGDSLQWRADCSILSHDDDYWSISIEQSIKVKALIYGNPPSRRPFSGPVDLIQGFSMFLCDDVRGLEAALRDTVSASSAKSGQVMSGMVELLGMFG